MKSLKDEEFQGYVLDRRHDLLRSATLLTAGDRHQAEDVVQTTLTRLYLAWPLFTRAANRDGYARRALVNAFIDEQRRPWRRRERVSYDVPEVTTRDADSGTPRTEALLEALGGLPPRMRATIVCRYFHDLSVAETANVLNCSQGNVKSQTARALDHLRRELGEDLAEAPPPPIAPASTSPSSTPLVARSI